MDPKILPIFIGIIVLFIIAKIIGTLVKMLANSEDFELTLIPWEQFDELEKNNKNCIFISDGECFKVSSKNGIEKMDIYFNDGKSRVLLANKINKDILDDLYIQKDLGEFHSITELEILKPDKSIISVKILPTTKDDTQNDKLKTGDVKTKFTFKTFLYYLLL